MTTFIRDIDDVWIPSTNIESLKLTHIAEEGKWMVDLHEAHGSNIRSLFQGTRDQAEFFVEELAEAIVARVPIVEVYTLQQHAWQQKEKNGSSQGAAR